MAVAWTGAGGAEVAAEEMGRLGLREEGWWDVCAIREAWGKRVGFDTTWPFVRAKGGGGRAPAVGCGVKSLPL